MADHGAQPAVSVVLPVHDAGDTLADALACLAPQTLAAWEAVVALNGCTDDSPDIAHAHAARDGRVRVLTLPEAGIVGALNAGLQAARAPLIARFDADDLMGPERLAAQVAALGAAAGWTLVTCDVAYGCVPGATIGAGMQRHVAWLNSLETPEDFAAARFIDAPVAHPAVTFRRDEVLAVGGYRHGPFAEDHDLWLRLMNAGARFGRCADRTPMVTWRERAQRLTRTDTRYGDAQRRAMVHRHLLAGPLADGRRARVWGAGRAGRRHASGLVATGATVTDLIDIDAAKIGRRVAGGLLVTSADSVGPPDGRMILLAVASRGARAQIQARLEALGHRRGHDFLAVQ